MTKLCVLLLLLICSPSAASAPERQLGSSDPYAEGRRIIADTHRIVASEGVQEEFIVTLGGARQVVSVRGADRSNPILLFVHGGPASPAMPIAWSFQRPWEDYFTVVQWDQRGAGKSFLLNDPEALAPTLTPDRYRDDAIELIELLVRRYGHNKLFLLGHSWGSVVGLSVAAKRPDLLHAYIGMGQIIDMLENERVGIAWTLEQARARGDSEAVREIESLGAYPDARPFVIEKADAWRKHAIRYGGFAVGRVRPDFYLRAPRLSPDYTAADREAWNAGSAFTLRALWPRLADISFTSLRRLDVPVVMFLGRQDYMTPSPIVERWIDRLRAPQKLTIWFEGSAHLPMMEEPGRVFAALLNEVRPLAVDADED